MTATYDGTSDDLLTAGLGWDGLQSATLPVLSATPTASELRRRAIYRNHRALVDFTTAGGYGVLYGPNVPLDGSAPNATPLIVHGRSDAHLPVNHTSRPYFGANKMVDAFISSLAGFPERWIPLHYYGTPALT